MGVLTFECGTSHTESGPDSKNTADTNSLGQGTSKDHEGSVIVTRPDGMPAHIRMPVFGFALLYVFPHILLLLFIMSFFYYIKFSAGCIFALCRNPPN